MLSGRVLVWHVQGPEYHKRRREREKEGGLNTKGIDLKVLKVIFSIGLFGCSFQDKALLYSTGWP